jgi:hypothetical protein
MNKKWLAVIGSGGVLIAALVVANYLLTAAPAPLVVVKDFWTAMELHQNNLSQQSNYIRAYALFDSDLQREQSLQEFQELATSHSSFFRAGNRQWVTNEEDGTATVEGRFTIEDDVEVSSALFRLVKQNDTWEIVAYRIKDEVGGFAGGTIPF